MKWPTALAILAAIYCPSSMAYGQLRIATNGEPQQIFFGPAKSISVILHNSGNQIWAGEIRIRMIQTSSATSILISDQIWKTLQVLPGQTIVESAQMDFPEVKAETKFLVQWVDGSGTGFQPVQLGGVANKGMENSSGTELTGRMPVPLLGITEVLVYPTNLLAELKHLADDEPLGVFDPSNQLKPLLKNLGIAFANLESSDLENFSGKLAIVGPFSSKAQMRDGLGKQLPALTKKGVAVVWLQPPPGPSPRPSPNRWAREELLPSFYFVPEGSVTIVVVQPSVVAGLADNPQSQRNLVYFSKLALHPQPPALPDWSPQP